jgi:toxin ParE1/3/4
MSKVIYLFRPQARLDTVEIALYIAKDNPDAAEHFLSSLQYTCEALAAMPEIGRNLRYDNKLLKGIRALPIKNFHKYFIFYRTSKGAIEIIRVIHAARDMQTLFIA